jgi:hypothetical protein
MQYHLTVAVLSLYAAALCLAGKPKLRTALALITDDSDIKIAPQNPSEALRPSSENERRDIDEYVRQRDIGNIALAHSLGERLKNDLPQCVQAQMKHIKGVERGLCQQQLTILFAYAVNRAIKELSPNEAVAQTALSGFYEGVLQDDADSYKSINESGAFSMYIYVGRQSDSRAEDIAIGEVFAGLCGASHSGEMCEQGAAIFRRYFDHSQKRINETDYQK